MNSIWFFNLLTTPIVFFFVCIFRDFKKIYLKLWCQCNKLYSSVKFFKRFNASMHIFNFICMIFHAYFVTIIIFVKFNCKVKLKVPKCFTIQALVFLICGYFVSSLNAMNLNKCF